MPAAVAWSYPVIAAGAVFLLTYVLISLRQLRRIPLERPAAAMLGAGLMLALGVLTPAEALVSISLDVLLLLVGMMLLVAGLEVCGFFEAISAQIAARASGQRSFLAWLMIATAILSALVLNDTVVLIMTPVVVRTAKALRLNPVPYLVAIAIAANVGSVATPVGNPQNAYIAIRSGISFLTFTAYLLPVMLVSLGLSIALVLLVYRRDFSNSLIRDPIPTHRPIQRPGIVVTLTVLAGVIAAFLVLAPTYLPLAALAGGAFVLFFLPFFTETTPRALIGKVDWSIIIFFIGLFVVLGGVRSSGLSSGIQGGFTSLLGGEEGGLVWLTGLAALLSILISNVPAVLLLAEVVQGLGGQTHLWLALASSSTLAGNATIIAAAANVIVVQSAARDGVQVSMKEFMKAGVPVTVVTLVVSTFMLALIAPI